MSFLQRTRDRLAAGDPATRAALDALVARAEPLLTRTPPSVMDKTRTPPSGDKHDYMSIGPYWWPNPDTPDGLPYIRRDGEVHPDRYTNATDVHAMQTMSNVVGQLLVAFTLTSDARYGAAAAAWLRTWFITPTTRMNPNLRFAQAIPGRCDGRGIGIIDTTGLCELLRTLRHVSPALQQAGHWTPEDDAQMRAWVDEYLDWLLGSALGLEERLEFNNHGTWYDAQVAWYALYVGRRVVAREVVGSVLGRRIAKQIDPDGSQPHELARTRPISYTCFNLRGFMELAEAGEEVDIDLWHAATPDGRSLRGACQWLAGADLTPREKDLDPLEHRIEATYTVLRRAAKAYPDDPRFATAAARLPAAQTAGLIVNLTYA